MKSEKQRQNSNFVVCLICKAHSSATALVYPNKGTGLVYTEVFLSPLKSPVLLMYCGSTMHPLVTALTHFQQTPLMADCHWEGKQFIPGLGFAIQHLCGANSH